MASLTNEQKELLKTYKYTKELLENSKSNVSWDHAHHSAILILFNESKQKLEATGYIIDNRSLSEKIRDRFTERRLIKAFNKAKENLNNSLKKDKQTQFDEAKSDLEYFALSVQSKAVKERINKFLSNNGMNR